MQITEIRVRLVPDNGQRLKAYCTVTLDGEFVVRDLKIIDGNNGLFVPCRLGSWRTAATSVVPRTTCAPASATSAAPKLAENRILRDEAGKPKLNIDIAHPDRLPVPSAPSSTP